MHNKYYFLSFGSLKISLSLFFLKKIWSKLFFFFLFFKRSEKYKKVFGQKTDRSKKFVFENDFATSSVAFTDLIRARVSCSSSPRAQAQFSDQQQIKHQSRNTGLNFSKASELKVLKKTRTVVQGKLSLAKLDV